jgi:CubicO group peptidase (beta-lactamase class C family)
LPSRGGREITLRDLITHSAGLPFWPPVLPDRRPRDPRNPFADFDADVLYTALARTELLRDIGSASVYSNFGFLWLSEILGRVGGKPFDVLLRERVFEPLGMSATTVRFTPDAEKHRAVGHDIAYQPVSATDLAPEVAGSGGVRSSISDMTRLAEALAGRRKTPLDDTIALALQPLRDGGDMSAHVGYAWFLRGNFDRPLHWHSGGTSGFSAMLAVDRRTRTGAVVLSDVRFNNSIPNLAFHLVDSTWPAGHKVHVVPLTPDAAREYEGRYEISPTFTLTIFNRLGRTYSQGTNQQPVLLKFLGKDRFDSMYLPMGAQLQFARSADGKVDRLTLIQGGRERPALRDAVAQP